jgi:hypothetical protein
LEEAAVPAVTPVKEADPMFQGWNHGLTTKVDERLRLARTKAGQIPDFNLWNIRRRGETSFNESLSRHDGAPIEKGCELIRPALYSPTRTILGMRIRIGTKSIFHNGRTAAQS